MILMPQIFNVTANENVHYKRNELECLFSLSLNAVHSSNPCMMNLKMVILFKDSFILLMYKVLGRKKLAQVNKQNRESTKGYSR